MYYSLRDCIHHKFDCSVSFTQEPEKEFLTTEKERSDECIKKFSIGTNLS